MTRVDAHDNFGGVGPDQVSLVGGHPPIRKAVDPLRSCYSCAFVCGEERGYFVKKEAYCDSREEGEVDETTGEFIGTCNDRVYLGNLYDHAGNYACDDWRGRP